MCLSSLDEGFKSSSYLTETLLDPEFGHASEANKAAFNKAHNTGEDMWNWFKRPDNKLRLARFGASMDGMRNTISADAILEGSVIVRGFEGHHVTQVYRIGRVLLGGPPRRLTGCRCWRWHWLAVVDARYTSSAPSLRCPGPRVSCWRCNRGVCIYTTGLSKDIICLTGYG
jgi:hypothetical protein